MRLQRALGPALLAAVWLACFASPSPAGAEGPGTGGRRVRLDDEPAGPYRLRVVTSPTPPRVENLYVEVRVTDASSGEVITDADVRALVYPEAGGEPILDVVATHDIAPIPTDYAAHLPVPAAGVWQVEIQVDGRLGPARAEFLERIVSGTAIGAILSVGAPVAGLVILGLVFMSLQRNSRKAP